MMQNCRELEGNSVCWSLILLMLLLGLFMFATGCDYSKAYGANSARRLKSNIGKYVNNQRKSISNLKKEAGFLLVDAKSKANPLIPQIKKYGHNRRLELAKLKNEVGKHILGE